METNIPEGKEKKQTGQSRDEATEGDEECGKGKCGSERQEDIGPTSQSSKSFMFLVLSPNEVFIQTLHIKLKYYFDIQKYLKYATVFHANLIFLGLFSSSFFLFSFSPFVFCLRTWICTESVLNLTDSIYICSVTY